MVEEGCEIVEQILDGEGLAIGAAGSVAREVGEYKPAPVARADDLVLPDVAGEDEGGEKKDLGIISAAVLKEYT